MKGKITATRKWIAALAVILCMAAGCKPRYVGGASRSSQEETVITVGTVAEDIPERLPTLAEVDNPYQYVTEDLPVSIPQGLAFLHPSGDTSASSGTYYLTGVSDPDQPLLLNGEEIENRGHNGSFARSVALEAEENKFTLQQGAQEVSVTIRKGNNEDKVPLTDKITKMQPEINTAEDAGGIYTLQCIGPAGGQIRAEIAGETIELKQNVAAAQDGVPATFSAQYRIPEKEGIALLGTVTYFLNGTAYPSEGQLFSIASGSSLTVELQNEAVCIFSGPSVNQSILTTGRKGAVDTVIDFGGDNASGKMYQLGMGGWIQAAAVSPVPEEVAVNSKLSGAEFVRKEGREIFTFHGDGRPLYRVQADGENFVVRFYQTSELTVPDLGESRLFLEGQAEQDGDDSILTLSLAQGPLWGYCIEYEGTDIKLTCLPCPSIGTENLPLDGITVAVDPGHGGTDTGTLGLPYDTAPMEKDVARATAEALKRQLGLLGARVILVREGDENPTMNARMKQAREAMVDFYISLHCNGAGYSQEMITANGVEVYYFEPASQKLAESISSRISEATGRKNRGAQHSYYRVTMQSFAPSVLVELGFLPNPGDFDSMCSKEGIYQSVTAISESLVEYLQQE